MPVYTYKNETTDELITLTMSISEMDEYVKNNPHMLREYNVAAGVLSVYHQKPDNGFRDLLKDIKKRNSRGISQSNINTW